MDRFNCATFNSRNEDCGKVWEKKKGKMEFKELGWNKAQANDRQSELD